jgi:hypothetical protein
MYIEYKKLILLIFLLVKNKPLEPMGAMRLFLRLGLSRTKPPPLLTFNYRPMDHIASANKRFVVAAGQWTCYVPTRPSASICLLLLTKFVLSCFIV